MILTEYEDETRYTAPPDDEPECVRWDEPEDDIDWLERNFENAQIHPR